MSNYDILGLKKGATDKEIKVKFRALCKIHHPDMGGDSAKFIVIQAAYEALLKGDSGEQKQQPSYTQQRAQRQYQQRPKSGVYRFEGIKKDERGHIVSFYVRGVRKIEMYGKDAFNYLGTYDCLGEDRIVNLRVTPEDLKKGKYTLRFEIWAEDGNYVEKIYKIKKPTLCSKIKDFFKNNLQKACTVLK